MTTRRQQLAKTAPQAGSAALSELWNALGVVKLARTRQLDQERKPTAPLVCRERQMLTLTQAHRVNFAQTESTMTQSDVCFRATTVQQERSPIWGLLIYRDVS
jgi:hypothetical protein